MDPSNNPDGEFSYGSGHVNPVKAIESGLVYDTVKGDNVRFLCSIGYDEGTIRIVTGHNSSCPKNTLPRDYNLQLSYTNSCNTNRWYFYRRLVLQYLLTVQQSLTTPSLKSEWFLKFCLSSL